MRLIPLGSVSAAPNNGFNMSGNLFEYQQSRFILFDCGEGIQHQIIKCEEVKLSQIRGICITHLHGDHVFGLPALLCTMSHSQSDEITEIHIYGPRGLRKYLNSTFYFTGCHLGFNYIVHEFIGEKSEEKNQDDIIGKEKVWRFKLHDFEFTVVPLKHTIESYGYVIQEPSKKGSINVEQCKSYGLSPGPFYKHLKDGKDVVVPKEGTPYVLEDNKTVEISDENWIIRASEVIGPPILGKKIVILGDTCDSSLIIPYAMECDLILHEATNENCDHAKAKSHGHSTPGMAGEFAKTVNAKQLVLTHFSNRYKEEEREKLVIEARVGFCSDKVIAVKELEPINI